MKVYLSKQAEFKLNLILTYLLDHWNLKIRNEFLNLLKEKINQISKHPESCPKSEKHNGIYKCVLSKQTTLFYRIKDTKDIEIITFFDNRQNPEKIVREI